MLAIGQLGEDVYWFQTHCEATQFCLATCMNVGKLHLSVPGSSLRNGG